MKKHDQRTVPTETSQHPDDDLDVQQFAREVHLYQSNNGVAQLNPGEFIRAWMARNDFFRREREEDASVPRPQRDIQSKMARMSLVLEGELGSKEKAWSFITRQAALFVLAEALPEFAYLKSEEGFAETALSAAALAPVNATMCFDVNEFRVALGLKHELQLGGRTNPM
jgi:hypothetical protein